ncbi:MULTISPECIES: hypothetical protein [Streptomyces]|uniref:Uncharacterized protein n=1 Tax=Streptomyces virginiae TaxID=1961 RepID=A0ABZ1TBZ3_STRVG|nr:hypothetical protein [Streptomyces virginiae]
MRPNLGEALDFLPGQHSDLASGGRHRPAAGPGAYELVNDETAKPR